LRTAKKTCNNTGNMISFLLERVYSVLLQFGGYEKGKLRVIGGRKAVHPITHRTGRLPDKPRPDEFESQKVCLGFFL
jgi:hypothetical protein